MTDDALKLAKPLDPIYANPKPGKPENPAAFTIACIIVASKDE